MATDATMSGVIAVLNPGFETSASWENLVRSDSRSLAPHDAELFAPPEGRRFAVLAADAPATRQSLNQVIEAGRTYTMTLWARSVNRPCADAGCVVPTTLASVGFTADGTLVGDAVEVALNPPNRLNGAAATQTNDDGANVFFDGDYRMQAGEYFLYQPSRANPIADPWLLGQELPSPANYAPAPIVTPQGLRALYTTTGPADDEVTPSNSCLLYCDCCKPEGSCGGACELAAGGDGEMPLAEPLMFSGPPTDCACVDAIAPMHLGGDPPDAYTFRLGVPVLSVRNRDYPTPGDAHVYYDSSVDPGRLWMIWGGWTIFVSELDPLTGELVGRPSNVDFDAHPAGTHVPVLSWAPAGAFDTMGETPEDWAGDAWSSDSYMEGPTLHRHDGIWYAFGSYGALYRDYTIRMCRREDASPLGAFVDREGLECTRFDAERQRYGASMFLGAEGDHTVPGHAHFWSEEGVDYVGYDYRLFPSQDEDWMGIRRVYWLDGWPTVWQPITVRVTFPEGHPAVGQDLGVTLHNRGQTGSRVGVDHIQVRTTE